jgi:hypothetical protein
MAESTTTDRIGDAIAAHVWVISTYILEMGVSQSRERQIARNIGDAVSAALKEQPS